MEAYTRNVAIFYKINWFSLMKTKHKDNKYNFLLNYAPMRIKTIIK